MQRLSMLLGFFLLILGTTACNFNASPTVQPTIQPTTIYNLPDLESQEIKIAITPYQPFNCGSEEKGWDYEVWGEICTRLNCQPKFISESWNTQLEELEACTKQENENCKYDVVSSGVNITSERKEIFLFSDAYLTILHRLVGRVDENRFENEKDFIKNNALNAGGAKGAAVTDIIINLIGEGRVNNSYEGNTKVVEALIDKDVDAIVLPEIAGKIHVAAMKKNEDRLKLIGLPLYNGQLAFMFPKNSNAKTLIERINQALKAMREDNTMDSLTHRYFLSESGLNCTTK